jgi:hypothetical protein
VPLEAEGSALGRLDLGPRKDGTPYTDEDREALQAAAATVARAVALAGR